MPGGCAHHPGWQQAKGCLTWVWKGWPPCFKMGQLWSTVHTPGLLMGSGWAHLHAQSCPCPASFLPPGSSPLYTICANIPIRSPTSREASTKTGIDHQIIDYHMLEIYKIRSCFLLATFNLTGVGCRGLNVCVPPQNSCWSPNPECDGIRRRWGLWKVIRSWGWSPR